MSEGLIPRLAALRARNRQLLERADRFLTDTGTMTPSKFLDVPLTIALLGYFDAGKSTLVNALLGENRAPMGAAPETKGLHAYTWNGLRVLDMPGRQAREQELEKALEGLREAHAILYVVSSEKLDDSGVLDDLAELRREQVPFIVAINIKHRFHDARHRDETLQMLNKVWSQKTLDFGGLRAHWIDAELARRGRNEKRPPWITQSRIEALEIDLAQDFIRSDALLKDATGLRGLRSRLVEVRDRRRREINDDVAETVAEQIADARALSEHLNGIAEEIAQSQFPLLGERIAGALEGALFNTNTDIEKLKQTLNEEIEQSSNDALQSFSGRAITLIQRVTSQTVEPPQATGAKSCLGEIPQGDDDDPVQGLGASFERRARTLVDFLTNFAKMEADDLLRLTSFGAKHIGQGAKHAAGAGRQITEGIKQTAQAARAIGTFLTVALVAVDVVAAYRAAAKEEKLLASKMKEVQSLAQLEAGRQRHWFLTESQVLVGNLLGTYIAERREELNRCKAAGSEAVRDVRDADDLIAEVDQVISELVSEGAG